MSLFDGLGAICDRWLGVDDAWEGQPPRYPHLANFQLLYRNGWGGWNGERLMWDLYGQISMNWSGGPCVGQENWRFEKQLNLGPNNLNQEVTLERTITLITDENWVNQVPIASGVDDTGSHYAIDLLHRSGSQFTFIELKVEANHPLYAAIQIIQYGLVYVFSRIHADQLGYQMMNTALLRAGEVRLQVLAPATYYNPPASIAWLLQLENSLNTGLEQFARKVLQIPMGFMFRVFPTDFLWVPAQHMEPEVRKDLLWALHNRNSIMQPAL